MTNSSERVEDLISSIEIPEEPTEEEIREFAEGFRLWKFDFRATLFKRRAKKKKQELGIEDV